MYLLASVLFLGSFGAACGLSWMPPGASVEGLGGLLGSSWGLLGGSWGHLGAVLGPLGAVLDDLEAV